MPNTYACKGVSNPNVPIFPPRVCTLVLFINYVKVLENDAATGSTYRSFVFLELVTFVRCAFYICTAKEKYHIGQILRYM